MLGYVDIIPRQLFSSLLIHISGVTIRPREVVSSKSTNTFINSSSPSKISKIKISVGFLGNFCDHGSPDHSVTLLTKGVIQHLNRTEFDVVMLSVAGNVPQEACQQVLFI
jgi:predicted O-linked N-acetylglucosamine transferase (SPINDLY family)